MDSYRSVIWACQNELLAKGTKRQGSHRDVRLQFGFVKTRTRFVVGMNWTVKKVSIAQAHKKVTTMTASAFVASAAKNHVIAALGKFNFDRRYHAHAAPVG